MGFILSILPEQDLELMWAKVQLKESLREWLTALSKVIRLMVSFEDYILVSSHPFRVLSFIVQFISEHMTQPNNLREKSQVSLSGSALLRPLQLVLSLLLIPLTL